MPNQPLRIAIIGLRHGAAHLDAIDRQARARVAALADIDPATLQRAAAAVDGDVATFTDVRQMARSGVADAAVIAVPTAAHAEVTEICLGAGLHVLLEKPLCRNSDEAGRIGAALQRSGRVLQIGYEVRSSPLHRSIMRHIADGDLGQITNVWWHQHTSQLKAAYDGWRQDRANMGGALFDCSPHFLDIIAQWAGAPVRRLMAMGNVRGQTGPCQADVLPESAVVVLEYANGVRGTFNFGAVNDFRDDATFGVAGTTGCIRGNPISAGEYELRAERGTRICKVQFDPAMTSAGHLGFNEQWDFFLDTVLNGQPNICSFADALAVHRMMLAIDQSLASGLPVDLLPGPAAPASA